MSYTYMKSGRFSRCFTTPWTFGYLTPETGYAARPRLCAASHAYMNAFERDDSKMESPFCFE